MTTVTRILDPVAPGPPAFAPEPQTLVGTMVGRIRIQGALGQGGMGTVYVGFDETLNRKVALKAIRDERRMDADSKARFLREARILSRLDHPCICRIYDLVEEQDCDYIVLELIEGESLKEAAKGELEHQFKLHLAEKVAEALVAAHEKGIAHRDLKPENVMLADDGGVKVLDFGLAYSVGEAAATADERAQTASWSEAETDDFSPSSTQTLPDFSVRTEAGLVMGTVAYMSPEQARGERVSEATDLYSFGLLLQELFTGQSAYSPNLGRAALLMRAAAGQTRPAVGIDSELASLIHRLKSFEPEARPTAATTLAMLRRIRTRPQRRLIQAILAVLAIGVLLGAVKYTIDLRRGRAQAIEARREAEQVSDFLVSLFAVASPRTAPGIDVTARELLDVGARRIGGDLRDHPLTRSRLMRTMGQAYRQLGFYERALPLLEEALAIRRRELGDDDLEVATDLDALASLHHDLGDYAQAEPLFLRALEIRRQKLGGENLQVAASQSNLAFLYRAQGDDARAEPLFRQALEIHLSRLGEHHPDVARSRNNLGNLYRARGEHQQAEPLLLQAIEAQERLLPADHPELAESLNNLAILCHEQGLTERAEPLYRRTLATFEKVLGPEHPDLATILNNLAELYRLKGDAARAEPLYLRALEIQQRSLGAAHPSVAVTLGNLADLQRSRGELELALGLYRRVVAIQEEKLGPGHPALAASLGLEADLLVAREIEAGGQGDGAQPLYDRALAIAEKAGDSGRPSLAVVLGDLGRLKKNQGRYAESAALFARSVELAEKLLVEQPHRRASRQRLATSLVGLGEVLQATGEKARAAEQWERALEVMAPITASSQIVADFYVKAVALLHLGRLEEARPLLDQLLARGFKDPDFLALGRKFSLPMTDQRPASVTTSTSASRR